MSISELSVRRPVLMTMVYILIAVIAAVFISSIDLALYPSVDMPVLSVMINCDDAGPEEIEQQVAKPLETSLSSVENIKNITSRSSNGNCMIMLEFEYGTDLDEAKSNIQSIITRSSRSLPSWASTPEVMSFNGMSGSTVMNLTLSGPRSVEELQAIAEDTIQPMLERIPGVADVDTFGGGEYEYDVNVSTNRLNAYGVTLSEVAAALSGHNIQSTAGSITQGNLDYNISIDGRYSTVEEIEDTVIALKDGVAVRLSDIADIELVKKTGGRESYLNGNEIVSLDISNTSDSSSTTVAKAIKEALPNIISQLDSDLTLTIDRDSTEMISSSMNEVVKSAVEGVILAALVIFLFLRNFKATIIIALSMPICILITLMVMSITGITVNSMSMSGLILGIGMIVDASIIILENTYYYRSKGEKSAIAAIKGSHNMLTAIVASTLTTLCVFVPLIIYKYQLGMIGIMFQDLVITVCISLASSLFVAITLVPALSGSILKLNTRTQKPLRFAPLRWADNAMSKFESGLRNAYAKVLGYFLNHRLLLIVLLVLILLFSLTMFSGLGMSLTPQMTSDDSVSLSLTLEAGTNNSVTRAAVFAMNDKIKETLPDGSYNSITMEIGSSNTGSIRIALPDITEQKYSAKEIQNMLRPLLSTNPSETWSFGAGRGFSANAVDVEIHSNDASASKEAASRIEKILNEHVSVIQDISSDLTDGAPMFSVDIDYDKAGDYGVSVSTISSTLNSALSGLTATEITTFSTDTTYDLVVKVNEDDLSSIDDIASLAVPTKYGNLTLDNFVTFTEDTSPRTITRENKERVNHITANAKDGVSASVVQSAVNEALDAYLILPEGVTIEQAGEMTDFNEFMPILIKVILLALFLVYAVMAAQFESLLNPFIIFATIPLLLIGVIWIHIWTGTSFTMFSIVGIVALIGVVVNNGIVLVDAINRLIDEERIPVREACLKSAKGRLRPILMTTLTTILGMIPLAFFPGEGSEMLQPIALTFVGGIVTGAFLTLLLTPVLYSLFNQRKEKHYDNPDSLKNQLREYDKRKK